MIVFTIHFKKCIFRHSLNNKHLNGYLFKIALEMPFLALWILTTSLASFFTVNFWLHTRDLIPLLVGHNSVLTLSSIYSHVDYVMQEIQRIQIM